MPRFAFRLHSSSLLHFVTVQSSRLKSLYSVSRRERCYRTLSKLIDDSQTVLYTERLLCDYPQSMNQWRNKDLWASLLSPRARKLSIYVYCNTLCTACSDVSGFMFGYKFRFNVHSCFFFFYSFLSRPHSTYLLATLSLPLLLFFKPASEMSLVNTTVLPYADSQFLNISYPGDAYGVPQSNW